MLPILFAVLFFFQTAPTGKLVAPKLLKEQPMFVGLNERNLRSSGHTEVRTVVDTAGVPGDISVVRSSGQPDLDARAVEAVAQYRFKPGTLDGQPVRVEMFIQVNYPNE